MVFTPNNYYPFGIMIPERTFSAGGYRYGFNGQERDDEVSGVGNHNTALFWGYDTRLGRRWNLDPKQQINISDYSCFSNNPIVYKDILGDDIDIKYRDGKGKTQTYDYKPGEKYNGKNKFLISAVGSLNKVYENENGKRVINNLESSKNMYHVSEEKSETPNTLEFIPNSSSGGTIKAGFMVDLNNESQKIESVAHELFHGYQKENKEKLGTTNSEVGAYLFGRSIALSAGYGIGGFGLLTTTGKKYENAMTGLLIGNKFDFNLYKTAINTFKAGSVANKDGHYNRFLINNNESNPLIKSFVPLIK